MPATPEHADELQDLIEKGRDRWPLPQEVPIQAQLAEWAAFRESDRAVLKRLHVGWDPAKPYTCDPLPERIASVFPDLIFGADPKVTAASVVEREATIKQQTSKTGPSLEQESAMEVAGLDQEQLDAAIEENDLPSELQEAAAVCVSEGEVWWRIFVDTEAFEYPVVEWHSRRTVLPLWRGRKALAVAFIEELDNLAPDAPVVRVGDDADPAQQLAWREGAGLIEDAVVFRYVEIQTMGMTRNLLYRGERNKLGDRVALDTREELADLEDEWQHDLEVMLAGRVANGRRGRLGRSQYHGVKDLLYALNESADIGRANAKLTLRKRAIMPAALARPGKGDADDDGTMRARAKVELDDVFLVHSDDEMDPAVGPLKVLEYSFDAAALSEYDNGLTDKILTRVRVAPQLVGRATEGAATGPALRARLLDSILAANGMARAWDDELPRMLLAMQLVMTLSEAEGGYGIKMTTPGEAPAVERSSTLPEDEDALVQRLTTEVGGEILSRRTAIHERHPDWSDERVEEELKQIDADKPAEPAGLPPELLQAPQTPDFEAPTALQTAVAEAQAAGVEVPPPELPAETVAVYRSGGTDLRVRGFPPP